MKAGTSGRGSGENSDLESLPKRCREDKGKGRAIVAAEDVHVPEEDGKFVQLQSMLVAQSRRLTCCSACGAVEPMGKAKQYPVEAQAPTRVKRGCCFGGIV